MSHLATTIVFATTQMNRGVGPARSYVAKADVGYAERAFAPTELARGLPVFRERLKPCRAEIPTKSIGRL
jgi:hypothetical protein